MPFERESYSSFISLSRYESSSSFNSTHAVGVFSRAFVFLFPPLRRLNGAPLFVSRVLVDAVKTTTDIAARQSSAICLTHRRRVWTIGRFPPAAAEDAPPPPPPLVVKIRSSPSLLVFRAISFVVRKDDDDDDDDADFENDVEDDFV